MTKRYDRPRRVGRFLGLMSGLAISIYGWSAPASVPEGIPWRSDLRRAVIERGRRTGCSGSSSPAPGARTACARERGVRPPTDRRSRTELVRPREAPIRAQVNFVDRFGLTGIPATIVLNPAGQVVAKHEGYVDAATFHAFLEKALLRSGARLGRSPRACRGPRPASRNRAAGEDRAVEPRIALDGFCPISLVEGILRLIPGQQSLSVSHDGLSTGSPTRTCGAAPETARRGILPVNGGRCPVTQVDRGESAPAGHVRERPLPGSPVLVRPTRKSAIGSSRTPNGMPTSPWPIASPARIAGGETGSRRRG